VEIPRYWRDQKRRLLTGFTRVNGKGPEYSLDGRHWSQPSNGHHEEKNPLEAKVVYQVESTPKQSLKGVLEIAPAD
jgi:hypothetical protein